MAARCLNIGSRSGVSPGGPSPVIGGIKYAPFLRKRGRNWVPEILPDIASLQTAFRLLKIRGRMPNSWLIIAPSASGHTATVP